MNNKYTTTTLSNGLRVIHEPSASQVVYCGYVVCAGTRHEAVGDAGMAHFIEHMSFKGTQRRKACHITNGLERVGGDLNAFTNKQETVYHATVLKQDVARAIDLLTDMVFASTYPQREIDREVEVICDEIDSYKDSPSEIIFDEFESLMYPGAPLGRDILGTAERLRTYTTADARRFVDAYYRPENTVFYVYGDVSLSKMLRMLEKAFAKVPLRAAGAKKEDATGICPTPPLSGRHVREKGTHQAHVLLGAPAYGGNAPERFALMLLNNMLGGPGMNSRLNVSLRERAGLVYSVDAYLNTYPDTGFWNVYFGCDPKDVERCLRLVRRELDRFMTTPLTQAQLLAAKKQIVGQIGISCDHREGYALALGKTYAHYGIHRNVADVIEAMMAVTAEEVQQVAARIYQPEQIVTLIYQ